MIDLERYRKLCILYFERKFIYSFTLPPVMVASREAETSLSQNRAKSTHLDRGKGRPWL